MILNNFMETLKASIIETLKISKKQRTCIYIIYIVLTTKTHIQTLNFYIM